VIRRVVKRSSDNVDGSSSDKRTGYQSADNLTLGTSEGDSKAAGDRARRRRLSNEGGSDGKYVKSSVEGNGGSGSGRGLTESDVSDCSRSGEYTETHILPTTESSNGLDDVVSAGDLQNVRTHSWLGITRYDDRSLGLIFGARRTTPWPPDDLYGGSVAGVVDIGKGPVVGSLGSCGGAAAAAAGVIFFGSLAFPCWSYLER
jgi:hypothetical protein